MKNRPVQKVSRKITRQNIKAYLNMHGIPPHKVNELLYVMTSDAMEEANAMIYDRIYSLTALMLKDVFGFGRFRIKRAIEYMSIRMQEVSAVKGDWTSYADELREKTGFVMHTDSENRLLMQYQGTDWETGKDVTDE